jgi:multicomponent Na+:H+ antiporter subunit D
MTSSIFPPALVLIAGAVAVPFFRGMVRRAYLLLVPVLAFAALLSIPGGTYVTASLLGHALTLRIDGLSLVFGYVFIIITFIGLIYAFHVKGSEEQVAALVYAGAALGAVFAGDLITLFIFWELMTLTAAYIIWSQRTKASRGAGLRYIMVHIFGGMSLLAGIILRVCATGSTEFGYIGLDGLDSYLILLGFIINAAVPPLHAWLTDAYPEASVTGVVFLSAFTTKTAVYVLARAFPGTELLVAAGVIMTVYPIFYVVLENDLRRVLSYSLINQVGFMLTGIGLGTVLAMNGATAHVFCHILYKALLFMAVGAVLYRTGTCKATELGGLYKTMPVTMVFCIIGIASIAAFPLFSGFVSKSMVLTAAGNEHLAVVWFLLLLASAGVFPHAEIKIPYFIFFARDSGKRPEEAPPNMLVAMGMAAFLCVFIGIYPAALYSIMPYPVDYVPYTADHVISQLALLCFASLAFVVLVRSGYYPPVQRSVNLDTDWLYRKGLPAGISFVGAPLARLNERAGKALFEFLPDFLVWFGKNPPAALKIVTGTLFLKFSGPEKRARVAERVENEKALYPGDRLLPWSIGAAVSFVLVILLVYLVANYRSGL